MRAAVPAAAAARWRTWVVSSHDIEEHKRVAAEASSRTATLESRIEERTTQGEDASRELEAFTYSVSHDLRSPLRRVDGFAELLGKALADDRPDKVQHYLGRISAEAQRAGQLIDDLLGFSRAGRTALRVQPVDAERLVADVRAELGERNGRTLVWDVEPLPAVSADPAMLRVVFANLLSNAVKYTAPRAEAHIRVGSRRGDAETIFFVADDGVGFDMRHAGQLFGVFQRLHLAEEFEGSGIGLAIVERVVSRHGGRAWAEAEEGKGATFYFSLPDRPEVRRHA
jgi:light-regulated signal transduction histidine kinase (bacteriophytochrome)